jgi:hypothetical protein
MSANDKLGKNVVKDISSEITLSDTNTTLTFLRRIVKMIESSAVVDSSMRQRVAVENLTTFVQGTGGGLGVPSTNGPTAGAPVQASSISYIPVWPGPVDPRYSIMDQARMTYASSIRANITF